MRIATPTEQTNTDAEVSPRFGRSSYLCIFDTLESDFSFITNSFKKDFAVGNKVTKLLLENNVDYVIVQKIGDKTFKKLSSFKIKSFQTNNSINISDLICSFLSNELLPYSKNSIPD